MTNIRIVALVFCVLLSITLTACADDKDETEIEAHSDCHELETSLKSLHDGDLLIAIDEFSCGSCIREIMSITHKDVARRKMYFITSEGMFGNVSSQAKSSSIVNSARTATIQRCASGSTSICVFLFKNKQLKLLYDVSPSNVIEIREKLKKYMASRNGVV
jgi:hypothetical protein